VVESIIHGCEYVEKELRKRENTRIMLHWKHADGDTVGGGALVLVGSSGTNASTLQYRSNNTSCSSGTRGGLDPVLKVLSLAVSLRPNYLSF
jgi:hypothetical protein